MNRKARRCLREGKVKEALASYRALIALNPNAAVHHLQVANVLLEAGMGEAARDEARLAVKLDPTSALAERTLADILKHDLVGRNLRAGSDWPAQPMRTARRSSSILTITRRRATWRFFWNTIRWAGGTAGSRT